MTGYNQTARFRELYASQSRKAPETPSYPAPFHLNEPSPLNEDVSRILDYGSRKSDDATTSLASRVFGQQLGQAKVRGSHLLNRLGERLALYHRHMADLRERISASQNQLSMAKRPYGFNTLQQIASIERLLLQLESEERRERLGLWQDSGDMRGGLLEASQDYWSTRNRASLLGLGERTDV